MFFKKKEKVNNKFLEQEIDLLKNKLADFELEVEKIKSHIISLRGFVNRRLGAGDVPSETSKSKDGLDSLRF